MKLFHIFNINKIRWIAFSAICLFSLLNSDYTYGFHSANKKENAAAFDNPQKAARGIVVNEDGEPLMGVRIIVSKSLIGVTTDIWGRFAINNIPDGSSLIFSCNGYKTYTMPPLIVSNSALHVRLVKDPDFNEKSTETKHKVDSAAKPLIVINGKISEIPIEELDPQTIESMNVLKDKTATDKYGVEGKNGVIEIITKEPTKEEKPIPRSGSSRMRINY